MTSSGRGKSVTVTECHSNRILPPDSPSDVHFACGRDAKTMIRGEVGGSYSWNKDVNRVSKNPKFLQTSYVHGPLGIFDAYEVRSEFW